MKSFVSLFVGALGDRALDRHKYPSAHDSVGFRVYNPVVCVFSECVCVCVCVLV